MNVTVTRTDAGPPAIPTYKVKQSGTYSVGAGEWRIVYDYGTLQNGVFTPDNIPEANTQLNPPPGGNGTWTGEDGTTILGRRTNYLSFP